MAKEYLFGDLHDIGSRVKEIDPALRITYDARKLTYKVTRGNHQVMTVPAGKLDNRVLMALREGNLHRYRRLEDYIDELEAREAEQQRRKEKELSDHVEAATLDKFDKLSGVTHHRVGGIGT